MMRHWWGFPGGTSGKELASQCRRRKRGRFNPWVGKIPWRRAWQPTPVSLPGESHGQRSLADYSWIGPKQLSTHTWDIDKKRWGWGLRFILRNWLMWLWRKVKVLVSQLCLTFCNSMNCSLLSSSVHGILWMKILEWVAIPFSRKSSWPRGWTWVSYTVGRFFTIWATREALTWLWALANLKFVGQAGSLEIQIRIDVAIVSPKFTGQANRLKLR